MPISVPGTDGLIGGSDLASYPGITQDEETLGWVAGKASALVLEAWRNPTSPAPAWVRTIAETVAVRFLANPRNLESYTASADGDSLTERFVGAREGLTGLFLTDGEQTRLSGRRPTARVGSARLAVPGYQR